MFFHLKSVVFALYLLLSVDLSVVISNTLKGPKLIVFSIDGFRYDYLSFIDDLKKILPFFHKLTSHGVLAEVLNVVPTKTFPSHLTLVTGLYPETHGLIGVPMYDPLLNETFLTQDLDSTEKVTRWLGNRSEPIWITNQRQKGKSCVIRWPVANGVFYEATAFNFVPYYPKITFIETVEKTIEFLVNDECNLILVYYEKFDDLGHEYGVDKFKILEELVSLNTGLGKLYDYLDLHNFTNSVNIILTSDHGMVSTSHEQTIFLQPILSNLTFSLFGDNSFYNIFSSQPSEIVERITQATNHIHACTRDDIPSQFHYSSDGRIGDVIIFADSPWSIPFNASSYSVNEKGLHGYLPQNRDMHPIFIAYGPSFRSNYKSTELVNMIDIYSLMCHLLNISPALNNGSMSLSITKLLSDSPSVPSHVSSNESSLLKFARKTFDEPLFRIAFVVIITVATVIFISGMIVRRCIRERKRYRYRHPIARDNSYNDDEHFVDDDRNGLVKHGEAIASYTADKVAIMNDSNPIELVVPNSSHIQRQKAERYNIKTENTRSDSQSLPLLSNSVDEEWNDEI